MKIGIDAKWYFTGPPSGINVIRNIVDKLIEINHDDNIVFFMNKRDSHLKIHFEEKIAGKKNFSFVFIPGRINFITNLFIFPFFFLAKEYDVIMFQNYIPLWGRKRTRFVVYIHDLLFLDYPQYFTKIERLIYKLMILSVTKADHIITISRSEQNRIIKHCNISSKIVSYVYHGIDDVFYERPEEIRRSIKKKYNLPEKYILSVGRINIRKNIKTLLNSFSKIHSEITLVVVGNEENKGFNFNEQLRNLKIKDKVIRLGHLPALDLAEIFSGAAIFVFPSYAEGFGLPPIEAMKSGVPVIVSERTVLPEICGDAAMYFDADNASELAKNIDILLTDEELYLKFKNRGLMKSQDYSWRKSVLKILRILKNEDQIVEIR